MGKKSSPVDVMVGQRMKSKRQSLGLSQEKLAEQVNLDSEALAEYEAGLRRLRAGTLLEIARALNVPPQYFFAMGDELAAEAAPETPPLRFPQSDDTIEAFEERLQLHKDFAGIINRALRKIVVDLVAEFARIDAKEK